MADRGLRHILHSQENDECIYLRAWELRGSSNRGGVGRVGGCKSRPVIHRRFYWLTRRAQPFELAPRLRLYLHKEFRDGEIRLYLHKEFRAAALGDDATENDNFQRKTQRLQGPKILPGAFISYS